MSDEYHEKETIRLLSGKRKSRLELDDYLLDRGYKREDEFYFLDRPDTVEAWQSLSVLTIDVYRHGNTLHGREGDIVTEQDAWDELCITYLLATLPVTFIDVCADECESLAEQFDLKLELDGRSLRQADELRPELNKIANELTKRWGEPGSESLGILIELSYQ